MTSLKRLLLLPGEVLLPYTGEAAVQRRGKSLPRVKYFVENALSV